MCPGSTMSFVGFAADAETSAPRSESAESLVPRTKDQLREISTEDRMIPGRRCVSQGLDRGVRNLDGLADNAFTTS